MEANRAGRPFLVEAPMENIVVPTPGCWNINDIYTPNELVKEGKLVKKENGQYVAPTHSKSHTYKKSKLYCQSGEPRTAGPPLFCRFSPAGSVLRTGDRALRPSFFRRRPHPPNFLPWKPSILMVPYLQMR